MGVKRLVKEGKRKQMSDIPAKLVKELRDKTGAGMMDCKRALVEAAGDISLASGILRKKGLMDAAKKSSRVAAEGLVGIALSSDSKRAAIVEVNAETDFVAKNDKFQALVRAVAAATLAFPSVDEVLLSNVGGVSIKDSIDSLASVVGENITLRRAEILQVEQGVIGCYIHNAAGPFLGKIGVLVAVESETDQIDALFGFSKKLAMHIAASNPLYLCSKCVPPALIDKETEIVLSQAKSLGKNSEIAAKMVEGRLKKYFEEIVLLDQIFFSDSASTVSKTVSSFSGEIGSPINVSSFCKFVLGEGIEKAEVDFVGEVMSYVK
jgi:elongation factor Ts